MAWWLGLSLPLLVVLEVPVPVHLPVRHTALCLGADAHPYILAARRHISTTLGYKPLLT